MINATETAPTLLTFFNFTMLFCGIIVFTWGKTLPGKGVWLIWAAILLILTGVGLDSGILLNIKFKTRIWMSGWIWPREDLGAITVGILHDPFSFAMSALSSIVAGAFLLNHKYLGKEEKPESIYAGLAISTAGVTLAWNSLTPWLCFGGITLTLVGGFISLGSRSNLNPEADCASRFARERTIGFLLAFFGACALATTRHALIMSSPENWLPEMDSIISTWAGSILLVVGIFIQMQPFPFLGWIVSDSKIYFPARILLNQIFPAWASFSLLVRLETQFSNLGLFPNFGWIALISCTLATLTGFFQNSWRQALSAWLAAGFSLSCAFLAFSGTMPAIGMLLGVSLGVLALSSAGTALEKQSIPSLSSNNKAIWFKIASFLGVAAGTGVFGFISATGGLHWIAQAVTQPAEVALFLLVFFLFILLGWKMGWKINKIQNATDASWISIVSVFLWIFLALGLVWTGTATGEILIGNPDRLFRSFFGEIFGNRTEFSHTEEYITASSLYWGAILIAFFTSFWTTGNRKKEDPWEKLATLLPRTSKFIRRGYGIDTTTIQIKRGIVLLGRVAEEWIDNKIWNKWIPIASSVSIKSVSQLLAQLDAKISIYLGSSLKELVEVPAKLLQMIQTGDIRWYLLFALGSGFALLSHFLKI